jgi:hypothetical protein
VHGQLRAEFICGLCRAPLPANTITNLAGTIVRDKLVASFNKLLHLLGLSDPIVDRLLSTLLQKHDFDLQAVESAMFRLVGVLVTETRLAPGDGLNRVAVDALAERVSTLQTEQAGLALRLSHMIDTACIEFSETKSQLVTVTDRLTATRLSVAREVCGMLASTKGGGSGVGSVDVICVDLRGLSISDTKHTLDECIVPILSVFGHVTLVCNKQKTNMKQKGKVPVPRTLSPQAQELFPYLQSVGLKCEVVGKSGDRLKLFEK